MSDEKRVPETLETIAEHIRALGRSMTAQFEQVDKRFEQVDKRFDELKAQLRTEIEAVASDVTRVYDAVIAQNAKHRDNDADHAAFRRRFAQHDLRLLALERRKRKRS